MKHIVKREGRKELFDDRKLYASVYAACSVMRITDEEAESIAERVTKHVSDWIAKKAEVSSSEIRETTYEIFRQYNPDAAYLYHHHKDIA